MHAALLLTALLSSTGGSPPPTPQKANPGRLAIAEPATPPALEAMGAQVAQWVDEEATSQGITVVSADDVSQKLGRDQYAQLRACHGVPTCVAAMVGSLQASRIVVGTLDRDEQSYLVHLYLVDLSSARVICEMERNVRIATRRLAVEVKAGLGTFLKGRTAAPGTLLLSANQPDAAVTLDGEPAGKTPLKVALPPGRHEVELQLAGHFSVHRWVNIVSAETTQEELRLLRIPGTEQPTLPTLASPETHTAPPTPSALGSSTPLASEAAVPHYRVPLATWISGGVAVAAGATGMGLGISSHQLQSKLNAGYNPTTHVYSGTRTMAITARNRAIAADALFAASGVAALTALGFALFAPQTGAPQASLSASPSSVTLSLGGGF